MKKLIMLMIVLVLMGCSNLNLNANNEYIKSDLEQLGVKGKAKSITTSTYSEGEKIVEVKNLYNKDGNLIETSFESDFANTITTHFYNEKGKIKKSIIKDKSKGSVENVIYNYNKEKSILRLSGYDINGDLLYKYNREYDENGNKIKDFLYFRETNKLIEFRLKYDKEGRLIENLGSDGMRSIITYSKNGDIYVTNYYGTIKVSEAEYVVIKRDLKGNPIERKVYSEGKFLSNIKDEIEYYNN